VPVNSRSPPPLDLDVHNHGPTSAGPLVVFTALDVLSSLPLPFVRAPYDCQPRLVFLNLFLTVALVYRTLRLPVKPG
jgi:hypothetical protein